jgi:exopolyphosphatase/guanosine-5'-triphosphate,3'-diphosphate pyrophosphatase
VTRVAGIDCGTNSIRLLVADVGDGPLTEVVRTMEIVRLGEGVDRTGRLSPAAIERTRVALEGYAKTIASTGAERVRMVATSASRDASNADDFRTMVREVLGQDPEVITGDAEARLSFAGALGGLRAEAPYLVVDIGGGSTEFVLGTDSVEAARSVDIGCVRLTERHLHDDPPTAAQIAAVEADIRVAVALARETVPVAEARTLVGLAGTVTTVTALALGLPEYDSAKIHHARISAAQVADVTAMLLRSTRAERAGLAVMHPGRVDVIGAGALVLRVLMDEIGATELVASEHDILDGIALSLVAG